LRLLSSPSTATRWAIGVVPRAMSASGVTSIVVMSLAVGWASSAVAPVVLTGSPVDGGGALQR